MNLTSILLRVLFTLLFLSAIMPVSAASRANKYRPRVSLYSIFKKYQTPPNQTVAPILTPAVLPATGGILKITASVVVPTGKPTINAQIFRNEVYFTTVNMTNGNSGIDYVGMLNLGNNPDNIPYKYTATVYADDSLGNRDCANADGVCVQAFDNTAPVITNATVTPTSRPATGGIITVKATVSDIDTKVTTVGAAIFWHGLSHYGGPVEITLSNGGSGNNYTGNFNLGVNNEPLDIPWTTAVVATDICGNRSSLPADGICIQPASKTLSTISITDTSILPSTLPVAGGNVSITCKLNNPSVPNTPVYAELLVDNLYYTSAILLNYSDVNGTYSGDYAIPRNDSGKSHIYTAIIYQYGTDNYVQATSIVAGSTTIAADTTPPSITAATITPATLTAAGGSVTVSATITDDGGDNTGIRNDVSCQLFKDGLYFITSYPETIVDGVYKFSSYGVPVNHDTFDHEYSAVIITNDNTGKQSVLEVPNVSIQAADNTFPVITSATMTTANLPVAGGPINVSVNMPVFADMATHGVQIYKDSMLVTDIGLGSRQNQLIRNPVNNHVYEMVTGQLPWTDARDAAAASTFEGVSGHLATITSADEMQFVKTQLGGATFCWLGGYQDTADPTYSEPAGGWKWVTDEPFEYTTWSPGYPNNAWWGHGTDNYLKTWGNADEWVDQSNDFWYYMYYYTSGYIVEYDTTGTTVPPLLATYNPGPNTSTIPHVFTAVAYAVDTAGNRTTLAATGSTTQVNDNVGPVVSAFTFTPAPTMPVTGGTLNFTATITEPGVNDSGINDAYVKIYRNGNHIETVYLSNGETGNIYTASATYGLNTSPLASVYTADIVAADKLGNTTFVTSPTICTQASDSSSPTVTSATITSSIIATPLVLAPIGGTITISATIVDTNSGFRNATGYVIRDGIEFASFGLTNGGTGSVYTGSCEVGINHDNVAHSYIGYLTAFDNASNRKILALTGTITQATDKTGPTITNVSISPSDIPDAGGTVTVTATVTDAGSSVSSVIAEINMNGTYYASPSLINIGENIYSATYDIPANTFNTDRTWKAVINAVDNCTNRSTISTTTVNQPTSSPSSVPTIENALLSPASISASAGHSFTVTADVSAGNGIGSVSAYIFRNGLYYTNINMDYTGEASKYSATYPSLPSNAENFPYIYSVIVIATDNDGYILNTPAIGTCTQANDHAGPVVTLASLSPATRLAPGGTLTVTATVNDAGVGVNYVYARIFLNSIYYTNVGLSNGGSGSIFTGSYSYGVNPGPGNRVYSAVIDTQDLLGNNTATAVTGTCIQVADGTGPDITTPTISPATVSPTGGPMLITAKVADAISNPTGISAVTAYIYRNGAYFTQVGMNKLSGTNYSYLYNLPVNNSTINNVYTVVIYATDNAGIITHKSAVGTSTQAFDNLPPVIGTTMISPMVVAANGGLITVSAVVTDTGGNNTGVKNVSAYIKQDGINYTSIPLTNGSNGDLYAGTFNIPSTIDKVNHNYTFSIIAFDKLDNYSTAPDAQSCFQRTDTDAGGISGAIITPKTVPVAGGNLVVNATVSGDGNQLPTVIARINCNGVVVGYINLSVFGPYQTTSVPTVTTTGNFTGTFAVPANTDGIVREYTATVYSTDMHGLASAGFASGECTQPAGAPEGALPVIKNAAISPASMPINGGYIHLTATIDVTKPVNYYSVSAYIYRNGIYYTNVGLSADATGNNFSVDYLIPANTSGIAYTFTATIYASDGSRTNSSAITGTSVQGYDSTPPSVNPTSITSAMTISPLNNTLIISGTIADTGVNASGLSNAYAYIYRNGQYITNVGMTNNGIGDIYTGEYAIPVNAGKTAINWTSAIRTTDIAGNITLLPVSGNVSQPKDNTAPTVTGTLTPESRPSSGGYITINATVTDTGSGINTVKAQIFEDSIYRTEINLDNGGSGNVYTGSYYLSATSFVKDVSFTAVINATDLCGNINNVAAVGSCVIISTTPGTSPEIVSATITPDTLPSSGGVITLNTTINGIDYGQQRVLGYLIRDNIYYDSFVMNDTGNNIDFTYIYTLPANASQLPHVYSATIVVQRYSDWSAVCSVKVPGNTTVATDNAGPVITSATLSPAELLVTGGLISISANVTDIGSSVTGVQAQLFKNGVYFDTVGLTNTVDSTFTATYNITTPNRENIAWVYTAVIIANDVFNNVSTLSATGTTTQPFDITPPSITLTSVTPATLSATGGQITVTASITDANFNYSWGTQIFRDDVYVTDITFTRQNQLIRNPKNNHVYKMVPGGESWWQAREAAAATSFEGVPGHLATVSSVEEMQFIQTQLGNTNYCWLGGYQDRNDPVYAEPSGGWKWVTDEPFTYTQWVPGYPNNGWYGVEDYLKVNDASGNWIDCPDNLYYYYYWYGYSYQLGYIVEYDTTATTPVPVSINYPVGINKDATSHTYRAVVYATDMAGNRTSIPATGTTVQATDNVGPAITNTMLTPTTMLPAGGTIYFSANVVDVGGSNTGVSSVTAVVYQKGLSYTTVTLTNGGSGSLYTGEINVSINNSQMAITYSAIITATDVVGNRTYLPSNGTCIQATSVITTILTPEITYPEIGPKALTSLGGDIFFTAKITSPVGVESANAQIFDNGAYWTTVGLTKDNDGITYYGKLAIPINADLFAHIYTASIYANDNTGNQTSKIAIGSCVQATDSGIPNQPIPAPTITSFTPAAAGPNMQVAITGTNFIGVTSVLFDGNMPVSFTVVSETTINAIVAPDTTSGTIIITTMGGTAESLTPFTYIGAVSITDFTPTTGGVGTVVNINGLNFDTTSSVTINGKTEAFTVVSPTLIQATVAAGTTSGPIAVTTLGGTATTTVPFTFVPAPTINGYTPNTGPLGQVVNITGTNLATATAVTFNGVNAASFTVVSNTAITAVIAVGTTTGKVSVTTLGGTATTIGSFTFIPAPTITSFTPTVGEIGTVVTITGTNFTNASSVKFNGLAAASYTVVSSTSIKATVAAGTTSGAISITTPGGSATSVTTFEFVPKPTLTFFTPTSGGADTVITIIGTNLSTTSAVKVGGVSIPFTVVNDTVVTATISPSTVSGTVVVTTLAGAVTSGSIFTFIPAPTITSFTPATGTAGTIITITGSKFTGTKSVAIGGVPVVYTLLNATTILAVASEGSVNEEVALSGIDSGNITITTHGGTASSADMFAYLPVVKSFAPAAATVGKKVVITGTHLYGANAVTFNGTPALFTADNAIDILTGLMSTTITATVPVGATDGLIEVQTPNGVAYTESNFVVIPTLSAVDLATTPGAPRTIGTAVTLTATATGGASVQYKFMIGTAMLRDFSSSNTFVFTPSNVKTYVFSVVARDASGVDIATTVSSPAVNFNVKAVLSALSYTASSTAPWVAGSVITFTATATGGAAVQYKFMDGETILRDFAAGNVYQWTVPEVAGDHTITVIVHDANGINPDTTFSVSKVFAVKLGLSSVSMTTTPLNAVLLGRPVTLTATATGGVSVQYKFMYGAIVLRDFSAVSSYTFTPTTAKTYTFTVVARDFKGLDPVATVTSPVVTFSTRTALTAVSLTTTPLNNVLLGTPVVLTGTTTGGVNVQYKFMLGTTVLRDFNSSNTVSWTPLALRAYTLTVVARDLGGVDPAAIVTSSAVTITTKTALTAVELATTPSVGLILGTTATLTATATNGVNVQYKFMTGTTVLRDFASSNILLWKPATLKTYPLTVIARDLGGVDPTATITSSTINLAVKTALTAVSLSTSPASEAVLGNPVTLTATATNGAYVQYKFMNGTTILRDFAVSNTYGWTPSTANTYSLTVIARDTNGADPTAVVESTAVSLRVRSVLTAVSLGASPLTPSVVNGPVTLTATATGGSSLMYKFLDGTTVIRDFEAGNTCIWTPTDVTTHNLTVVAKDILGIDPTATVVSTVLPHDVMPTLTAATLAALPTTGKVGVPVTLTGTATGGASVQYKFMYGTLVLRDFSSSNTMIWTPGFVKTYLNLTVVIKDTKGTDPTATVTSPAISYVVTP